jgi:hypothetical protein
MLAHDHSPGVYLHWSGFFRCPNLYIAICILVLCITFTQNSYFWGIILVPALLNTKYILKQLHSTLLKYNYNK